MATDGTPSRGKSPFTYILRFSSDPRFDQQRDMRELEAFVKAAEIDDVTMLIAQQDTNTGHLSLAELEEYFAYFASVQAMLRPLGVSLSINQWYSLMHEDLGQRLRPEQRFTLMRDRYGRDAQCCVCPADEAWQDFFCACFERAAALHPHIVWVEDDFRYHNHSPLQWGGCFCQKHMQRYSRKAGEALDRDAFAAAVIAPGEPHPHRRIWLDTCREIQEEVAGKLGAAVRRASAYTKVGLMTSAPQMHAAEGRHWSSLLAAFAAGGPMVNRVHLPCYVEKAPAEYLRGFNMVSMLSRHFTPKEAEIYPELENFPYSLFAKSKAFSRFQLLSSLPLEENGIAMNLFDLNGNGIVLEDGLQRMLAEVKPYLNARTEQGVFKWPKGGVRVLCSEDSGYTLHTRSGDSFDELCPSEAFFGGLLPAMGIPFRYSSDPAETGGIAAVSGQYFRNLSATQIEALFAGATVLLDGEALETLCDMGLGHLAGVRLARWMRHNGGEFSYEQTETALEPFGAQRTWHAHGRASAVIACCDALKVDYGPQARPLTAFHNMYRERVCSAVTLAMPKVLVFPFGHYGGFMDIPPMLLGSVRQAVLQRALADAMNGTEWFPMALGAAHLAPYYYRQANRHALYLTNATSDGVDQVRLYLPGKAPDHFVCYPSDGEMMNLKAAVAGDAVHELPLRIPPMACALLAWED